MLAAEATPISDHRASAAYRTAMLGASLRKFLAENTGTTPPGSSRRSDR